MSVLDQFLKDTKDHTLKVHHDQGVHRYMEASNNGSSIFRFDITTWPGHLCISRDMGTYVFQRTEDMLGFFRSPDNHVGPYANCGYWFEKCVSHDRRAATEWDAREFMDHVREYAHDNDMEGDALQDLLDEAASHKDDEHDAIRWAMDEIESDAYEWNCRKWRYNAEWCLYAINWATEGYWKMKGGA